MRHPLRKLGIAVLLLGMGAACGPIQAQSGISRGSNAMKQARLAKAQEANESNRYITPARYEYELAHLFIEKAKELQGFSKFEAAAFYGNQARDLAEKAAENKHEEERRKIRRKQIKAGKVFHEQR